MENNDEERWVHEKNYSYKSKEVSGDKYAFDVIVKHSDGRTIEFRVLTMGEVKD